MIAKWLVQLYCLVHGRWHLRGAGVMLRTCARFWPGLQAYPLAVEGAGVAAVDFRDLAAFSLLNGTLGELGDNARLVRCLEAVLKPGNILWDVGANVGFIASYFSHQRFRLSQVHCFEPSPRPAKVLQSLFAGNPLVKVHAFGLGDREQKLALRFSGTDTSVGSLVRDSHAGQPLSVETTVQIRVGDAVRQEMKLPPPDVIKVDVEGFEASVFNGLK